MLKKITYIDHAHTKFYDYFGAAVMLMATVAGVVAFIMSVVS